MRPPGFGGQRSAAHIFSSADTGLLGSVDSTALARKNSLVGQPAPEGGPIHKNVGSGNYNDAYFTYDLSGTVRMQKSNWLATTNCTEAKPYRHRDGQHTLLPLRRVQDADEFVEAVVASWNAASPVVEKRRWHRILLQMPIAVAAFDISSNRRSSDWKRACGCDLSWGGVSFQHVHLLSQRHAVVTFLPGEDALEPVVVRLTWCRFLRQGIYQSGGRFLRKVDWQFGEQPDWDHLEPA